MKMKLELMQIPVTDLDRAKAFYVEKVGFDVDVDVRPNDTVRMIQLTPPGSACSIGLWAGLPNMEMQPGSVKGLHLWWETYTRHVKRSLAGVFLWARSRHTTRASSTLPSATPMLTSGPCCECRACRLTFKS